MAIINNPLKQYFRRPAIFLKLPSGGAMYKEGVILPTETGELPIYPMTAIDEITSKTPDALYNGTAIVDIMKSCVPNILDPWSINSIDFDAILIGIKTATGNNDLSISTECPSCKELAEYGINLVSILNQLTCPNYNRELEMDDLKISFRPLTYKEMNEAGLKQTEIQRIFISIQNEQDEEIKISKTQEAVKLVTETTMKVLSKTISYIKTPTAFVDSQEYILDFLKNCDKNIYETIRDYNNELKIQTQIKPIKIKCMHCQHEYDQPFSLNISDFFG